MKGIPKNQNNPKKIQKVLTNLKENKKKSQKNPKNLKKFQNSINKTQKSENCQKWSKIRNSEKIWKNLEK